MLLTLTAPTTSQLLTFLFATAVPVGFTVGLLRFCKQKASEDLDAHPTVIKVVSDKDAS